MNTKTNPRRCCWIGVGLATGVLAGAAGAQPTGTTVKDGAARELRTWAAKGMLRNPVAICFDPMGRMYIAESDRAGNAVQDTRNLGRLNAVEDDLKFRSVDDRLAQIRRWLAAGEFPPDYFTKTEDRVRVLVDTDGDGIADESKVFAGGFNAELDGIGAGVLWRDGTVYFTCIPDLWALRDTDGDLAADSRTSLAHGFGVRWCFYGHDLHGLINGPDGRLYFSMGDRGYNVTTREGNSIVGVDRGGVFRCWPDGSGLELYHQGLRNPQELAFNELGDLFTGDNNCDSGDRARLVHVVEGGDSGWRQDVQSLDSRGPWNREGIWKTLKEVSGAARPAWSLPPVEYMGAGPSGMLLYPGTGESRAYNGRLMMVDFYGSGATVYAFRCEPSGAGFVVKDRVDYYKGSTVTDIAWGKDGRLYLSDWGGGWSPNENGNVFTITNTTVHTDAAEAAAISEVARIIGERFDQRTDDELLGLLAHRDQRVRQGAQFALAARGAASLEGLARVASDANAAVVTRAHAIWGIGQIARATKSAAERLVPLLDDATDEVRVQAVRTLGDLGATGIAPRLVAMLGEEDSRLRAAACTALAHTGDAGTTGALLTLLESNDDKDLVLRHSAVYALSRLANDEDLASLSVAMGPAARLGAVVALRRMESPRVAGFLGDPDAGVAIEAARAVYDLRLPEGMAKLGAMLDGPIPTDLAIEPLMRRAIEANVLIGTDECATRLASLAARGDAGAQWRLLALDRLDGWDRPLKREGVWGNWVGLSAREAAAAEKAVAGRIDEVIASAGGDGKLLSRAYQLKARYALHLDGAGMERLVLDPARPADFRLAVFEQLAASSPDVAARVSAGLMAPGAGADGDLRRRAEELFAKADPARAVAALSRTAMIGDVPSRQHAVRVLASMPTDQARAQIAGMADDLHRGVIDPDVALEVYEAVMNLPEDSATRRAAQSAGLQGKRPAGYATVLLASGGDAEAGKELFLHHTGAECLRCHIVDGLGGTAGPNLTTVGSRLSAAKLVESIVEPGAEVAPGFGNITAMPEMSGILSAHEVRDVVAFLQTLREPTGARAHGGHDPHDAGDDSGSGTRAFAWLMLVVVGAVALLAGRREA